MEVVFVKVPEAPVMARAKVPVVAVLLAVNVKVLEPVVLEGLKAAVTPVGRPVADKLTVPENPF